jgi:hypothetical protein
MGCSIYALTEPDSEIVRYIGYTSEAPTKRYHNHLREVGHNKKQAWISRIKRSGQVPGLLIIEDGLEKEDALNKEIHYIKFFKAMGANLVNGTSGGDRGFIFTPDVAMKISLANKGRKQSPEAIAKTVAKTTGLKRSADFCKRLSERNLGKKKSDVTIKKMRDANLGKKQSPETIAKRVAKLIGRTGHWKGKKFSEETRKKMSESKKGKAGKWMTGRVPWNKGLTGFVPWNKGKAGTYSCKSMKPMTDETRKKMSEARMGKKPWNAGLKTGPMSEETKEKMRLAKRKQSQVIQNETNKL